ncbi:MAG: hypothetical protein K6G58_09030 [Lachnospiraceae bacterium]|nr:hypothetical protein [Lachnospiraceae bacterium]
MSRKTKKGDTREVKQIYLSEDGESERSVTTAVIEREEEPEEKPRSVAEHSHAMAEHPHVPGGEAHSLRRNRTIRVAAVVVAMVFSLLLSMSVGVGLALFDSGRTFAELAAIVQAKEMPSAISIADDGGSGASAAYGKNPTSDKDAPEAEKTPAPTPKPKEVKEVKEEDYGSTLTAEADGIKGVAKAGDSDEILSPDDEDEPALIDPLADYPLPFSTVDESYFTDALFIGDSRLQGFGFWSGLPATYYCATGFQLYKYDTANVVQTENGKVPIFEAMPYDAFTKIYIKVGLNELGFGTEENFENKYAELIAKLREYEPRAVIYVHAILPVTAAKSGKDKAHNNPNIVERNASLKQFAESQKAYFVEASPELSMEDGSLRPEMTSDGIHLKPEYMKLWREYLCQHAVVIQQ